MKKRTRIKKQEREAEELKSIQEQAGKLRQRRRDMVPIKVPPVEIGWQRKKPEDIFKLRYWKKKILTMMAEGASLLEVLAKFGMTTKMHRELLKIAEDESHPLYASAKLYKETIEKGEELAEAWWLKAGRSGIFHGRQFNANLFFTNMKNRYEWSDKQKLDYGEDTLKAIQDKVAEIADRPKQKELNIKKPVDKIYARGFSVSKSEEV